MKPKCFSITGSIANLGLVFLTLYSVWIVAPVDAQSPPVAATHWRAERAALDREFAERLNDIADWCQKNGIPKQVAMTLKLNRPRDLQRQYIFLPSEESMPIPPTGVLGNWLTKINAIKKWQADRIFELAKRAAIENSSGTAFQLLNEVLYFNKDHTEVRKILGHRKTEEGWRIAPDRIKIRNGSRPHDLCKWPAQSYLVASTQHFEIDSDANEEQIRYLAEKLERWHDVWRQVFFEYWCSPKNLQRWIEGKSSFRHSNKKFRVIFFRHRDNYVAQLAPTVRGVEASTGYYSSDLSVSFFYDDGDRTVEDTWRHELTHQLFRESINVGDDLFENDFIWLDEGIATYFESLTDFGDYVTLGGFEARRLQYARIRKFHEGLYVDLQELSSLGRTDLQSRPDMALLYSQVAGLTDMLMNDRDGATEAGLIQFLQLLYKGRPIRNDSFEKLLGQNYEKWDERYGEYLLVDAERVAEHLSQPLTRTELSLSGSKLKDDAYAAIGQCHNLKWLDLSKNQISPSQMAQLKNCQQLSQLFLASCPLEPNTLKALAQFSRLDELDLSASSVSDQQLSELSGLRSLTSLRLANTRVTDEGLDALAELKNLKSLDVMYTKISEAGLSKLKQQLPQLQVIK